MRHHLTAPIALAIFAFAANATAQTPAATPLSSETLKVGKLLLTSDGKRIGRIERVVVRDGAPVAASVIVDSRFVMIPTASMSVSDDRIVTSLTRAEVRKLD